MAKKYKNFLISADDNTTLKALASLFSTTETDMLMRGMRLIVDTLTDEDKEKLEAAKVSLLSPQGEPQEEN